MGTFAEFIESEAFFPVLILLLLLLMFTFVSILMSGRKKAKRELQSRKNIQIDENAQVQLVQHGVYTDFKSEIIDDEDEEFGNNEVVLVKEVEAVDLSEVEEMNDFINSDQVIKEMPIKDTEPLDLSNRENINSTYVKQSENIEKTIPNEEIPSIRESEELKEVVPQSLETEEFLVPESTLSDVSSNEEKPREIGLNDAFDIKPNGDYDINEDIEIEMPKEYDGEKTEILEFPDFDFYDDDSTQKIETQIINQANKYIESVMESRDNHEE